MSKKSYVQISVVNVALIYTILLLILPMGEKLSTLYGKSVYVATLSLLSSLFLTPFMIYLSVKFKVLDFPDSRKVHAEPTPLLGGAAIFLSLMLTAFASSMLSQKNSGILAASTIIFLVGFLDDALNIRADIRLLAQIAAAIVLYENGVRIKLISEDAVAGMIINFLLTLFWIVGITNAFNFLDGIDGLASSLAVVIASLILIISLQNNQVHLALLSLATIGATAGFIPYNFKMKGGADIFLGDSGSTFLGFLLASLAINVDWTAGVPLLSITAPVLLFWIPIYDMIHTTVTRIFTGRVKTVKQWIEYTGMDHLHHRMAALFGGNKQAVFVIVMLVIAFGISVLLLRGASIKEQLIIFIQNIMFILIVTLLEYNGNKAQKRGHSR